jgi:hypothetical protein
MKNKVLLSVLYEVLWFAIAAIAAWVFVAPVKSEISTEFTQYLLVSLFLLFTYFRFVAFMMHSILLRSIWVKLGLFVINIPLFFFAMNQYFHYIDAFNEYNYTLAAGIFQDIHSGTELEDLTYLRHLTVFSGVIMMLLIVLLEIRIIIAVFKLRQLDKYL